MLATEHGKREFSLCARFTINEANKLMFPGYHDAAQPFD
jgi:hypothetical protein